MKTETKGHPDGGKARSKEIIERTNRTINDSAVIDGETGTALASAASTAVGAAIDYAADAGCGMEGADKDSLAIPFIMVLQTNSPQCEIINGKPAVPGAFPGRFLNSVTNEVFDELFVIPVAFQRRYLEWAPRSKGGGFRGEHLVVEVEGGPEVANAVKWAKKTITGDDGQPREVMMTEAGNQLKDTRNHFVMARSQDGAWHPAVFSMSSTKIKTSKRWLSRMSSIVEKTPAGKSFNPPAFSRIYRFWTTKQENDKGKFFVIDFDVVEPVSDIDAYASAKSFYQQVAEGKVKVQQPVDDGGEPVGDAERF